MDNDFDIEGTSLLPIQFLDRTFRGAELQPEKRLQLAVLEDAATSYGRSVASAAERERAVFLELEEWFASDAAAGPFSFVAICDSLGFDPGYIRRGLRLSRPQLVGRHGRHALRRITGSRTRIVRSRMRQVA